MSSCAYISYSGTLTKLVYILADPFRVSAKGGGRGINEIKGGIIPPFFAKFKFSEIILWDIVMIL